jgi:hypothetical protein
MDANLTPRQVITMGSFGGTYFRPIHSAVTGKDYKSPQYAALKGLPTSLYTSSTYSTAVNKYKVQCGTTLEYWESQGWITKYDPYGWFQWYCEYSKGRRCPDDERQIKRWINTAGPNSRFRKRLVNMIKAKYGKSPTKAQIDDPTISPKIRQTLQHWAVIVTAKDF